MPKWSVKWPKKSNIPFDPVQPEYTLRVEVSKSLAPKSNLKPSHHLSPPVTLHDLGPVAPQLPSSFSLSFQHPSNQHVARKCPWPSIKKREQKGKALVINEEIVHTADVNGNGDTKIAQKRPLKRQKSESTNAELPSNG